MTLLRYQKPWVLFECTDCIEEFQVRFVDGDETPDCPHCWKLREAERDRIAEMVEEGRAPAVSKGIHGADIAYRMLEQDSGLTDMSDNLREGDIAFKGDGPRHTREMNDVIKEELDLIHARANAQKQSGVQIEANWNGQPQAPQAVQASAGQAIAGARAFAEQARQEGSDPLGFSNTWSQPAQVQDGSTRHMVNTESKVMPNLKVLSRADREGKVIPAVRRKG